MIPFYTEISNSICNYFNISHVIIRLSRLKTNVNGEYYYKSKLIKISNTVEILSELFIEILIHELAHHLRQQRFYNKVNNYYDIVELNKEDLKDINFKKIKNKNYKYIGQNYFIENNDNYLICKRGTSHSKEFKQCLKDILNFYKYNNFEGKITFN